MTTKEYLYLAEEKKIEGEIEVLCHGEIKDALSQGKAFQFYSMNWQTLKSYYSEKYPEADIWYTERNGDPIGMLVPKGTDPHILPSVAMDYICFEWIDPDKDFGSGVRPGRSR